MHINNFDEFIKIYIRLLFILTVAILFYTLSFIIFDTRVNAQNENKENTKIYSDIKFGKDVYYPGDTVVMSLRLNGMELKNLRSKSLQFEIEYDHFNFEIIKNEDDIKDGYFKFTGKYNYENEKNGKYYIYAMYADLLNDVYLKEGANVLKVKFKVKDSAKKGSKKFVLKPVKLADLNGIRHFVNNDEDYTKTLEILSKEERPKSIEFKDIGKEYWAKYYIDCLVERKVVFGVDANYFKPRNNVTRAEFAAFLVRGLELNEFEYNGEFKDVKKGKWYDKIVSTAVRSKIIEGTGNGCFEPDALVTREQMCAMVIRAYEYINGVDTNTKISKYKNRFKDIESASGWAKDYVKKANVLGIIDGITDTKFSPKNSALREHAAAVIVKLLKSSEIISVK